MAKNYSYPRVTMSTLAKKHSHNVVNVPDTTIMFAPLVTEKGPDDRVVKVHTLSEFIEIFGSFNEDFYELNGQMALNVYNWLSNGGTLMVKRLIGSANFATYSKSTTGSISSTLKMNFVNGSNSFVSNDMLIINVDTNKHIIINKPEVEISSASESFTEEGKPITIPYYQIDFRNSVDRVGEFDLTNYVFMIVDDEHGYALVPKTNAVSKTLSTKDDYKMCNSAGYGVDTSGNFYTFTKTDKDLNEYPVIFRISENISGTGAVSLKAKYAGEYYNDIQLVAEQITAGTTDANGIANEDRYFNFYVQYVDDFSKVITLEKFLQKNKKTYASALVSSEYIEDVGNTLTNIFNKPDFKDENNKPFYTEVNGKRTYTMKLSGAKNSISQYDGLTGTLSNILTYWSVDAKLDLSNRLETPIDIIFDAGYPNTIKSQILSFVRNDSSEATRPDIVYIMDARTLNEKLRLSRVEDTSAHLHSMWSASSERPTNVAIYEQWFTILDSVFTTQQIYVTPSYFLSKLFIYNDLTYGLQYPTAGLRRGILDDALWVNENPSPDQKETWFQARVNYVEKSSREYAFMSQRTFDGSSDMDYTALSFLNNERVLERMKKDLETIGRSYLHEFNDAITIANMSNALNKYVANWISNRTLSMGVVEVVQDEVSENALDINLNIRFTNTIEVINVSIVIE